MNATMTTHAMQGHQFIKRLIDAGFSESQAETIVGCQAAAIEDVVTNTSLKTALNTLRHDLTMKMAVMSVGIVGIIIGVWPYVMTR